MALNVWREPRTWMRDALRTISCNRSSVDGVCTVRARYVWFPAQFVSAIGAPYRPALTPTATSLPGTASAAGAARGRRNLRAMSVFFATVTLRMVGRRGERGHGRAGTRRMRAATAILIAALSVAALSASPSAASGAGGTSVGIAKRAQAQARRGERADPPRDVDLGAAVRPGRQRQLDHLPGASVGGRDADGQEQRRHRLLVLAVHATTRVRLPSRGAQGVRLAVRVRQPPGDRGLQRRRGGQGRRGLPGDRCRDPVRGQVHRGPDLHQAAARPDRPAFPGRARELSIRRFPPGVPILGLPRARRRSGQRAADVLEGHRNQRRQRVRAHLRLQHDLPAADLPAGAGLQPAARAPDLPLPATVAGLRLPRRQLVGLAGGDQHRMERTLAPRGLAEGLRRR